MQHKNVTTATKQIIEQPTAFNVEKIVEKDPCRFAAPSDDDLAGFRDDGFAVFDSVIDSKKAKQLCERLERVLRGEYDTGIPPNKRPKRIKDGNKGVLGFSGNPMKKTIQIINVWKCDKLFRELVLSRTLARVVATLGAGNDAESPWRSGARVAQDQVWAKPPGAAPLVFHRDSPYFDFHPDNVITVWIALDDMNEELGPLEYARGSHRWSTEDGRQGSASLFFQRKYRSLLDDAARREGLDPCDVKVHKIRVRAGGGSIHDGRTWHGSGPNTSKNMPRRGIGIHYVPRNVKWKSTVGNLWREYKEDGSLDVPDDAFPVTFDRAHSE